MFRRISDGKCFQPASSSENLEFIDFQWFLAQDLPVTSIISSSIVIFSIFSANARRKTRKNRECHFDGDENCETHEKRDKMEHDKRAHGLERHGTTRHEKVYRRECVEGGGVRQKRRIGALETQNWRSINYWQRSGYILLPRELSGRWCHWFQARIRGNGRKLEGNECQILLKTLKTIGNEWGKISDDLDIFENIKKIFQMDFTVFSIFEINCSF